MEEGLYNLYQDLVSGKYKHGPYKIFSISDPKPRKIAKATVRDRVVHHLVSKKLEEIYEPCFIYDLYSSRKGKGVHKAVKRIQDWLKFSGNCRSDPMWSSVIIKCDIRKFFASVDHEILINILEKKIKDEGFIDLLKEIICSFPVETQSFASLRRCGIPLGNVTSQIFANIYLNELDQFVKHRLKIKSYVRYCDDVVFICGLGGDCRGLINQTPTKEIDNFLRQNLKLELHPQKTIIKKLNQGMDFLGLVVFSDHLILRAKTKKRILNRAGAENLLPLQSTYSYFALLKWCESYKIRLEICKMICKK